MNDSDTGIARLIYIFLNDALSASILCYHPVKQRKSR